jgi:hypothetical protein
MSIRQRNYRRVVERPATTVDEGQHSLKAVLLVRAASHSKNKPDESRTCRPTSTFKEDFLLEHSGFGQQADSKEFAGCF